MDRLAVGMSVVIKRSDGRTHSAIISNLRTGDKMVDVEWFEQGETKGKALDIPSIVRFNPTLFHQIKAEETPAKTAAEPKKLHVQQPQNGTATARQEPVLEKPNFINNRRSLIVGPADKPVVPKLVRPALRTRQSIATIHTPSPQDEIKEVVEEPAPPVPANTKKSAVVLQAEEIHKNRIERRQQQDEARRNRDNLKNLDPGNPNWEFQKMIRDYRAGVDFRPLRPTDPVVDNRICVCVRKRPLSKRELNNKEIEVVTLPTKDQIVVHQPQLKVDLTKYLENQKFRFDYAFDDTADNTVVYRFTAQPLVRTIFQKGFATCFAYGQTGSGKTHTMGGDFEGKTQDCTKGIYALTATDVFAYLRKPEYRDLGLKVDCSFFELYGAKAFDLLNKKALLRILEDRQKNVQIVGLKEMTVRGPEDVLELIRQGSLQRTAGKTSANNNSSRSHAVFQIVLKSRDGSIHGKFSLIDLAGNERGADTRASDNQTRMEGAEINKSLLALKECIRAMGMMKDYIPFRGSKLTLVLRDSFIAENAKTCMIATISPGLASAENTLNTLRYADRAKELGTDGANAEPEYMSEDEEESPAEEEMTPAAAPATPKPASAPASAKKPRSAARKLRQEYDKAVEQLEQAESDSLETLDTLIQEVHGLYTGAARISEFVRSDTYNITRYHEQMKQLAATFADVIQKFQKSHKHMIKENDVLLERLLAEQELSKRL